MSGRRLLAAAGTAVFGLVLVATPASAAVPTVEWTQPTVDKPVLTELKPIKGTVSTTESDRQFITDLQFDLVPVAEVQEGCRAAIDGEKQVQPPLQDKPSSVEFELPIKAPCNGSYELKLKIIYEERLVVVPVPDETTASLAFDIAIPPAQVSGLKATYDEASKEVRLTWDPNNETDLVGYRVERNPPGRDGFSTVADLVTEPAFVDPAIDAEHRYRVVAVRSGPTGPIDGASSPLVTAGPDAPPPTVPALGAPTRRRPASSGTTGNRPSVRRRTATTVDTGFSQNLPFDPSQTTSTLPIPSTGPDGQAAVLAEFDDDGDDDRRATLVPIAGGLALLMSAVHMRLLSNRVGEDDIPILPGG